MSEQIDDHDSDKDPMASSDDVSSRRSLLSKGMIAAAIGAAAGLAATNRAGAANGDTMAVGTAHDGTATTSLTGGSTFRVTDGNSDGSASLYGRQTGTEAGAYGVRGEHNVGLGIGVYGRATGTSSYGVYGQTTGSNSFGVFGFHDSAAVGGTGVLGRSRNGVGVAAIGTSLDLLANGNGRIGLRVASTPPTPTANGSVGSIARDGTGALWYCYATNRWLKLAGTGTAGAFHPIAPKRVYDSRAGAEPVGVVKGQLNPGQTRVVDCTVNASGVPVSATAVALNLTAANTSGRGNLSVYPDGTPLPTSSSINYTAGVNIANATVSGCGPGAKLRVACGGSTGADFIVDIVGFYL